MQVTDIVNNPRQYYQSLIKESGDCDLCGSKRHKTFYMGDRYGMGVKSDFCEDCGLIFTNPRPIHAAMEEFYQRYYRLFYETVDRPSMAYIQNGIFEKRAQNIYTVLDDTIRLSKVKKVLDVGCSEGSVLRYIRDRHPGIPLEGIEPATAFAEFAASYASADIHTGNLQSYFAGRKEQIGTYDLIILSHVLEHFVSPSKELQRIWELLSNDGYLYLEVPNIASPYGGLGQFHIAHLYYFYPETLQALLLKSGFSPVALKDKGLADKWAMCVVAEKADGLKPEFISSSVIHQRVQFIQNKLPPRTLFDYTGRIIQRFRKKITLH